MEDVTTAMTISTDAGAVPSSPVAGQGGNQDGQLSGAVPGASVAGQEGEQAVNPNGQEPETGTEGEKGSISKPLTERIPELLDQNKQMAAKLALLESKLSEREQVQAQETPDFIEIDHNRLNSYLAKQVARMRVIEDEISIDPDNADPNLLAELVALQEDRAEIIKGVRENEAKKASFLKRQQEKEQQTAFHQEVQTRINDAVTLIAEHERIPADIVQAGRDFFKVSCMENPILQRQFDEQVMMKGPAAAAMFAFEYIRENMGKKQEQALQQREQAKETLPPGKTTIGEVIGNPQLDALRAKAGNSTEDLAAYMAAKKKLSA